MKVLNLQCASAHTFEGWFGSEEDYQSQMTRGLFTCPLCADTQVHKLPSAPRLNLGAVDKRAEPAQQESEGTSETANALASISDSTAPSSAVGANDTGGASASNSAQVQVAHANPQSLQMMQAAWMKMVRHVMANTEDVGNQFAEEARKMHYGEAQERSIRGQATLDETKELMEEGIDVMPLPVPDALKGQLQ